MPDRVTPAALRGRIALTLQSETKQYETPEICNRLGMPAEGPDAWTYNSKRVYVAQRLAGVPMPELLRIARDAVEEFGDDELERMVAAGAGVRRTDGQLKNIIFAAIGPKPRIILRDALDNIIDVVEGANRCLIYDQPLTPGGLSWSELARWWEAGYANGGHASDAHGLYRRLYASLASPPEQLLFKSYCARYGAEGGDDAPALIPQVYLHYDPYTKRELRGRVGAELARQRMDFLLLPNDRRRIVIEVDGQHHYADDTGRASPSRYAEMVAEERRLQMTGYGVFRFGAAELRDETSARATVDTFIDQLLGAS
jgi:very-short-patch-repair endonuclease